MSEDILTEQWADVPGFLGYQVSNLGRVSSRRSRTGKGGFVLIPRMIVPWKSRRGYLTVGLSKGKRGQQRRVCIHRLVLEVFVGPCPAGMEACHFPDKSTINNKLSNLRWGTRHDNAGDRIKHGTQPNGERCHAHKLTEDDVRRLLSLRQQGMILHKLAAMFGIRYENVRRICLREHWKHVASDIPRAELRCGKRRKRCDACRSRRIGCHHTSHLVSPPTR